MVQCNPSKNQITLQILDRLKANFNAGNPDGMRPDVLLNHQGDLLPYDQTFEFPRDRLKLGNQLGAGAFGVVMKATAQGISSSEEQTAVAVKMVNSNCNHEVGSNFKATAIFF